MTYAERGLGCAACGCGLDGKPTEEGGEGEMDKTVPLLNTDDAGEGVGEFSSVTGP